MEAELRAVRYYERGALEFLRDVFPIRNVATIRNSFVMVWSLYVVFCHHFIRVHIIIIITNNIGSRETVNRKRVMRIWFHIISFPVDWSGKHFGLKVLIRW